MSTVTTHTTANRAAHSEGLCKFNTTSKAFEISDGNDWFIYNVDGSVSGAFYNNSYSAYFDNANDYISTSTISELNAPSAWSFACWFRYQGTPSTNSHIFASAGSSSSNRWYIELTSTSNIRFGNNSAFDDITISTVNNTTWYHLVLSQSSTTVNVYLNGALAGSATVNSPSSGWGTSFKIGQYFGGGFPWSGYLDEVALFDSALTQSDADNIYSNKLYPSRFAFWRMENNVNDNEGNYTGANNGVTFVTSTKPY